MPVREAWGLDIGQTAIHAVLLERKGSTVTITDHFFHPLNTLIDDPAYEDKVEEALEIFIEEKNVGKTPVIASLPGYTTLFRDFSIPPARGARLREYVSFEAKQQIPYPLDEVVWDFHRMREDEDAGDLGIAVVCCRRDIVDNFLAISDRAGLNIEALQVGPIALTNYILYDTPPESAALILDSGARGTDFIVVNDGAFWLRSIGVSGTDFSRALMSKFSIPYEEAEKLKRSVDEGKQGERIFKVLEPIINNLCGEAQRSLGYYKSQNRGVEISEVVCAGNTFLLPGMNQRVADNLSLPTRLLEVPEELAVTPMVDEDELHLNRQVLGTAIGCALQAVGLAEISMTLLPHERRMQKLVKAKLKYAAVAVVLIALAVALNFLSSVSRAPQYEDLVQSVQKVQSEAETSKREYDKRMEDFKPEEERNKALASVAPTRAWLLDASGSVRAVVRELIDKADQNLVQIREDVINKESDELFRSFEAEHKDELTEPKQLEQLKAQIRRRIKIKADRMGRTFLRQEDYAVVKLRKATDPATGAESWECVYRPTKIDENKGPTKKKKPAGGGFNPGGFNPGGFNPNPGGFNPALPEGFNPGMPGMNNENMPKANPDDGKTVDAVEVILEGFVVTDEKREVLKIKDKLKLLAEVEPESISANFDMRSVDVTNTIMLPVITVPKVDSTTSIAVAGDVASDSSANDDEEEEGLKYETFQNEKIIEFSARFYYFPKEFHPEGTGLAVAKADAAATTN